MIAEAIKMFPNFQAVATTLRENLEIFDRVGGGDSFASGLIYAFLARKSPQEAVRYGARPRRAGHDHSWTVDAHWAGLIAGLWNWADTNGLSFKDRCAAHPSFPNT